MRNIIIILLAVLTVSCSTYKPPTSGEVATINVKTDKNLGSNNNVKMLIYIDGKEANKDNYFYSRPDTPILITPEKHVLTFLITAIYDNRAKYKREDNIEIDASPNDVFNIYINAPTRINAFDDNVIVQIVIDSKSQLETEKRIEKNIVLEDSFWRSPASPEVQQDTTNAIINSTIINSF